MNDPQYKVTWMSPQGWEIFSLDGWDITIMHERDSKASKMMMANAERITNMTEAELHAFMKLHTVIADKAHQAAAEAWYRHRKTLLQERMMRDKFSLFARLRMSWATAWRSHLCSRGVHRFTCPMKYWIKDHAGRRIDKINAHCMHCGHWRIQ